LGVFVALTLLARTMTVAYLPGLALAAGTQFLVGAPDLRVKIRNLAIAAAGLVAGPWYIRNSRSVYDSLVGSGYGEGAVPFGRHYPIASWGVALAYSVVRHRRCLSSSRAISC
jgi:hypothetical protein